jgi:hypothetical protein
MSSLHEQPLVELASIEFALHLTIANDLSVDEIRKRFHDAQVCEPTSLTIESCSILSLRLLDCATRNVKRCRTEICILTRTKNGFQRLAWYTSDDSKHCDKRISRHVLILSAHQGSDVSPQSEYPDPSFHLLTTSFAAKKNSAGNAKLNLDTLKGKFSLIVLVGHFVGRVTDNANDALDETVQTSNLLMNELCSSDNPKQKRMKHAFGVERRPIKLLGGDPAIPRRQLGDDPC